MANTVKIKQSSVAAKVPLAGDLLQGELAINTVDEKLYSKNSSGAVFQVGTTGSAADILTKIKTVDGSTSGLDADLLDGQHASAFATSGHTHSTYLPLAGGTLTGPLNNGTITADGQKDITLFDNNAGSYHNKLEIKGGSGQSRNLELYQVDSGYATIGTSWSLNYLDIHSNFDRVRFNQKAYIGSNELWNDSGTINAARYTNTTYTATQMRDAVKTVDGTGSGLDADLLDGQHASAFAASGHTHSYQAADGDLLAIGGLTGTSGYLKKTAADTWTLDTSTFAASSHTHSTYLPLSGGTLTGNIATAGISAVTAGTSNFVAGVNAGNSIVSGGNYNVVVGDEAGSAITTGDYNTVVGFRALEHNTTGKNNIAIGVQALSHNTTASYNTATGALALYANTTGSYNTALGRSALFANTTAAFNTATGYQALRFNTTAFGNTATGYSALTLNTTGPYNTATGYKALYANTTGGYNVALGTDALRANTTASNNTAVGKSALFANTTGTQNVALGTNALVANTTGNYNTATGYNALDANTTAEKTSAYGYYSLSNNTTGAANTAMGAQSLQENTTGANNTASGYQALKANTTGANNVAVGKSALAATTTAQDVTAVGHESFLANTTGTGTAIGEASLRSNTTGADNTALGRQALYSNTTAANNTAVGRSALFANTTGTNNTALGKSAGDNITTGSSNIIIGSGVDAPSATASNQLNIGDTIYGDLSAGNVGIGTSSPTGELHIAGSGSTVALKIDNTGTGGDTWRIWSTNDVASDGGGKLGFYNEDTATRAMTFDSAGNVGIGTNNPNDYHSLARNLVVASTVDTGITIASGTGSDGRIFFADGTSGSAESEGQIRYNHADDSMHFVTSDSASAVTIDSSGNVLVGTTDSAPGAGDTNTGVSFRAGGDAFFSKASSYAARFNRNTTDGDLVTFAKDGTNVGAIGVFTGDLTVQNVDTGLRFSSSLAGIFPIEADGTVNNGAIDLGRTNARFKDLHLSGTANAANVTLTGYLRGPASFVIDPAAHGDDTGTVVIAGNLQVDGTTTTINSTTITLDDKNIVLASGAATSAAADGAGITIDGAAATLTYANVGDKFVFNKSLDVTGLVTATTGFTTAANTRVQSSSGMLFLSGPSALVFETGAGSEKMRLTSTGLGIGVQVPTAKITLADHTTAAGGIKFRTAASSVSLWSAGSGNLNSNASFNTSARIRLTGGNAPADPDINFNGAASGTGFSRVANDITVITAATERLRIDSSGRLLLNASSTAFSDKLYVNGDAYVTGGWRVGTGATYTGKIYSSAGVMSIETDSNRDIKLGSATYPNIVSIDSSTQNVGINILAPLYPLDVRNPSDSNQTFRVLYPDASTVEIGTSRMNLGATQSLKVNAQNTLQFNISGVEKMRVHTNGNVGIGTSSPAQLLHVQAGSTGNGVIRVGGGAGLEITHDNSGYTTQTIDSLYRTTSSSANLQLRTGIFTVHTGSSNAERMRITNTGNVGIGVANPSGLLHIKGDTNSNGAEIFLQVNNNNTTDNLGAINFGNNVDETLSKILSGTAGANNSSYLTFSTSNAGTSGERMHIDSAGNVGIGNTVTQAHVNEGTYTTKLRVGSDTLTTSQASAIQIVGRDSTGSGPLGAIEFINVRDNDVSAKILARRDLNSSLLLGAGQLDFYTDDGNSNLDVRMSIDAIGNVGIGTSSPAYPLEVQSGGVGTVLRAGTSFVSIDSVGSAASPSLIFNGDANTGIWRPASDTLAVSTAGTERMRISATGDVLVKTADARIGSDIGSVEYGTSTANSVRFYSDNAERLRITNTGYVVVGDTAQGAQNAVTLSQTGYVQARATGPAGYFDRLGSDGEIVALRKDGVSVGSIGVSGGNNVFISGQATNHAGLTFATQSVLPTTQGVINNNTVDLGQNGNTFKDFWISGDIILPDAILATAGSTLATVTQTAITSFALATYGAAKFIVTAKTGVNRQITELIVTHDGTTAVATEYGTVATSGTLATYDVDVSAGNVRLLATSASASSTVYKVVETLIEA